MKKYMILLFASLTFALAGCERETEPGGTAVEKMAGDWWVTVDMVENGTVVAKDLVGHIQMSTYNTAANLPTEMFVDDLANFWDYKGKVKADAGLLTFGSEDEVTNLSYEDSKFKITNGKILLNQALSPSELPVDSIVFEVSFNDDGYYDDNDEYVAAPYAYTYRVSGFRRTGFADDDVFE
jgi:hypothetical protein